MQAVSDKWKEAHESIILGESFVEVSLGVTDPDAIPNDVKDNGAVYISNSAELKDGETKSPTAYCTLEQNLWCLDDSRKVIPESGFDVEGYVSDVLSDDTCVFSPKQPIITVSFPQVFSKAIPGMTVVWSKTYDEYPDTFEIIAYNGNTVVASKEVTGNRSVRCAVFVDIEEYDKIAIVVKKWCLPNRRARVEEIFVGIKKVYEKADLFEYSHSHSVDSTSTSLPKAEIKFSVNNVDREYDPYNTSGFSKYLVERQEIKTRYGLTLEDGSVEWIKGGTFYLSEWYAKQNGITAEFAARDLLEFMFDIYYDKDFAVNTERTLSSLAEAVLNSAELPGGSRKWSIDPSLETITTSAPLPEDTLANCLQLIANAGRCVLYQDREGILHIEPLKYNVSDYTINSFNSYSKSEITLSKPIKQVKVKWYEYTIDGEEVKSTSHEETIKVGEIGETITIDNPLLTSQHMAISLADWVEFNHRKSLDSSWRADVRLDPLDIVTNVNDYNSQLVRMTDVEFKFNGAFSGTGKGKVILDV